MRPMKVGYFVKMFPRLSETFVLNEILELERRGVEVVVFSLMKPDEGRFHAQASQIKAPVYYLDGAQVDNGWDRMRKHWPTLAPRRDEIWKLFEELVVAGDTRSTKLFFGAAVASATALDLGLDHLHAHFASTPSTAAYYASRISGLGFSFTAHAKGIFRDTVNKKHLEEKMNAARFVVTVTEFNKRFMSSTFTSVSPEQVKLVYNGIDLDLFKPDLETPRQPKTIFSVGRLVPKKGFMDLLEACSILKQRGVTFQCTVVGDGEQRILLEDTAQKLGLSEVVDFVGAKTQAEVRGYLNQACLFVLPCTMDIDGNQDALPTVLLEALAMGCPVVSTTISGVPEIVDSNVDGLLVGPGDAQGVASAMEQLLIDPVMASEFASKGRLKAEQRFDLKKNVAILEGLFRQGISESLGPSQRELSLIGGTNERENSVPLP